MTQSNDDIAIRVEHLGKRYRIGQREGYKTLRESMTGWLRAKPKATTGSPNDFWALDDVNFEVKQGEVVGIIGRNGAGKSTLLKVLSRITEPTRGRVEITGRVGSLLEVGTGFHPELTGRENVFLNGAILGMRESEIRKKFDEIVAFAEIEQFIDTPVKRYSSGMYTRLAFAVAAHLEPEILIVDEVLAVGDAAFQKKCMGKMKDVAGQGRTVLFVSHNMGAVLDLCTSSVLLKGGRVVVTGPVSDVVRHYLSLGRKQDDEIDLRSLNRTTPVRRAAQLASVCLENAGHQTADWSVAFGSSIRLRLRLDVASPVEELEVGVSLYSGLGQELTSNLSSHSLGGLSLAAGSYDLAITLGPTLFIPGVYRLGFGVRSVRGMEDLVGDAVDIEVTPTERSAEMKAQLMNAAFIQNATFEICPTCSSPTA